MFCAFLLSGSARSLWIERISTLQELYFLMSGSARSLWIERPIIATLVFAFDGRAPQGACGLKVPLVDLLREVLNRRAPQGACGLKETYKDYFSGANSRAPQGACGLKVTMGMVTDILTESGSARSLWIESLKGCH